MQTNPGGAKGTRFFLGAALLLGVLLAVIFQGVFDSRFVLHNNDAPLGVLHSLSSQMPGILTGNWKELNWLGGELPSASPTFTALFYYLMGPVGYAKWNEPLALLVLGLSAFFYLRRTGFDRGVAVVVMLAAVLNMNFFSNACWGQTSRPYALAATFMALGLMESFLVSGRPLKVVLAGFMVGWGIVESFDIGAIFSLVVSAAVVYRIMVTSGKTTAGKAVQAGGSILVLAMAAAWIAAATLATLIGTQIVGIKGAAQTAETKQAQWEFATQWSLPKKEVLTVVVPGLFGYRMDTPKGGQYWGGIGQQMDWEQRHNEPGYQGMARYTGSGEYAGVLVVLLAVFALVQSLRGKASPFSAPERKMIWFWAALAVICLLLSFGWHAPFYALVYKLPYFSTIRNPVKFMHPFHLALVVLFAYGLQALWRRHTAAATARSLAFGQQWKKWWQNAPAFDKKWVWGSFAFCGAMLFAWLIYASSAAGIAKYVQGIGYSSPPTLGAETADASIRAVGHFFVFLLLGTGAVAVVMSGWFTGGRIWLAAGLFGALVTLDLGLANRPWISYVNYKDKYESNTIVDYLKEHTREGRVTQPPLQVQTQGNAYNGYFQNLYRIEWAQHHFMYYDIQSIDLVQMPREPVDFAAFCGVNGALPIQNGARYAQYCLRYWELTNTRYLLVTPGLLELINQQLDKGRNRLRVLKTFDVTGKPNREPKGMEDLTVEEKPTGGLALAEFTGALPRVCLFPNWTVATNDQQVLDTLPREDFDPHALVYVAGDTPAPAADNPTNAAVGKVELVSYHPKKIECAAEVTGGSAVLLLNDRYDAAWRVTVDGQPASLLRCNYLMRGVHLKPGKHQVVFTFEKSLKNLYISLAAIGLGAILTGFLLVTEGRKQEEETAGTEPETK